MIRPVGFSAALIGAAMLAVLAGFPGADVFAGDAVPQWVSDRVARPYTPVSEDTDAILLYADTRISYRRGEITFREKRLYRILKVDGLTYGTLNLDITKDTDISDLEGYRLDGSGKLLETLEKENIKRYGFNDHFFDDNEQFSASFKGVETGDFIAFEYELEEAPFFKQRLIPMGSAIEVAEKRVTVPAEAVCAVLNDPEGVVRTQGTVYSVEARPALKVEDGGPALRERRPYLGILFEPAPVRTWEAHSRMVWQQTHEMTELSDETRQDLRELLAIADRSEFIRRTLKTVAETVRYVAIETGEERFIPRDVNRVHQRKYGDCKDMAYYAVAILRAGGVTADPVMTLTRRHGPVFESFPMHQFNHVVVAVTLDDKTRDLQNMEIDGTPVLIADLTDKHTHLSMIGDHLEDACILPVTQNGSPLLKIPAAPAEASCKRYDIQIAFGADRSAEVTLLETHTGHLAAYEKSFREGMKKQDETEIYRDWIQDLVPGAEMQAMSVDISDTEVRTEVTFSAGNLGTDVNDVIYYVPNVVDARKKGYRQRKRESDLVFSYRTSRAVDIAVTVDPVFQIVSVPKARTMDTDYFTASLETVRDGQSVSYRIRFAWKENRIPSNAYPTFRKQYRKYLKLAKAPIQLKPV